MTDSVTLPKGWRIHRIFQSPDDEWKTVHAILTDGERQVEGRSSPEDDDDKKVIIAVQEAVKKIESL